MSWASYGLAFLEGFGLILSPCILPILPIILSLGIEGPRWRPYGIILGFISSFSALTLLSRHIVSHLGFDTEVIRYISFFLLFTFALILLSETLSEKFSVWTSRFTQVGERLAQNQQTHSGFLSGIVFGVAIGCIWVPCAGPIMAAVIVQTITQQTTLDTALTLISFSIGAALPMLILILMGRQVLTKVSFLKSYTIIIRKILGIIIILSIIYSVGPTRIWSHVQLESQVDRKEANFGEGLIHGLPTPYPAPQIAGIESWINTPPLSIEQLRGKVVLIDFWTYSCINCVRTLPYLKKWDTTYREKGLVIIGIHSPEFAFERKLNNVKEAVKKFNIQYAVALDNEFKTWLNFQNHYWPAHYLIDKNGKVVYTHFGEGSYDITEYNIRYLLGLQPTSVVETKAPEEKALTPETYLGYERSERFAESNSVKPDRVSDYNLNNDISLNQWSIGGKWVVENQRITAAAPLAKINLHFQARKVFLVLGSANGSTVTATITLNGEPIGKNAGADVHQNIVTVKNETLYELVSQDSIKAGVLEVEVRDIGLQAYAFTFGG